MSPLRARLDQVSILGLARSPTFALNSVVHFLHQFQYLGSRGAQQGITTKNVSGNGFNTWAREEPNLSVLAAHGLRCSRFNTWAREEPNRYPRIDPRYR